MQALRICGHLPPGTLNDLFLMLERVKMHEQAKNQIAAGKRGDIIIDVEESKDSMANGITMREDEILTARNVDNLRMTTPREILKDGMAFGQSTGRGRTMAMPKNALGLNLDP
jgi:hypothetical protein